LELANRRALVAVLTLYRRVSPQEREAILVILDLLDGNVPPEHRVTPRAICPHLPLVNIRVTVLTLLPNVGKHGLDVALRAFHFFVHAAQRISGLIVVELRDSADGAPRGSRVAVLARNLQGAVRASRGFALRFRPGGNGWLPNQKKQPTHHLN
jgi:hypothetical protein